MKSIRNTFLSFAIMALTVHTCSKDPDNTADDPESYFESVSGLPMEVVQADWNKFMPAARNMIAVSESNLKSIRVKIATAKDDDRTIKWKLTYQNGEIQLDKLKQKLEFRNLQFLDELKEYDGSSGTVNTDFKRDFLKEIVNLNNALENEIDE